MPPKAEVDVVVRALLEKDAGLVEQDDFVPVACNFEDVAQFYLKFIDGRALIADCDRVDQLEQQL